MSEILDLAQRGELSLALPFSVKAELEHPNTPPEIKRAASGMIHILRVELTPNELAIRSKLLILIQENAKPGKHHSDVFHLFQAEKYGGGYFITKDRRLLKKSVEIGCLLASLRVVCPSDFMKYFRSDGCMGTRPGRCPLYGSALVSAREIHDRAKSSIRVIRFVQHRFRWQMDAGIMWCTLHVTEGMSS